MAGWRRGGALDSPDRAVFDQAPPSVWPSADAKAAGHLQCLGTQLWVGTAPRARWQFRGGELRIWRFSADG